MKQRVKDPDEGKGAVESGTPPEGAQGTRTPGLDEAGLPNDPIAIEQDMLGANEDESQG
jgi:hypothetical protein